MLLWRVEWPRTSISRRLKKLSWEDENGEVCYDRQRISQPNNLLYYYTVPVYQVWMWAFLFLKRRGHWSLSRRKSIFRDIERNLAGKRDNTRNISFSISFFYMLYLGNVDNFLDSVTHKHTCFSFYWAAFCNFVFWDGSRLKFITRTRTRSSPILF